MPLDWTFAIPGRSSSLKPGTWPTVSGARAADIHQFVDRLGCAYSYPRRPLPATSATFSIGSGLARVPR